MKEPVLDSELIPEFATLNNAWGPVVPIPIFPLEIIRIRSTLFVRKTSALLSVVPKKFVLAFMPLLPVNDQL
jgi:hypothetical protein